MHIVAWASQGPARRPSPRAARPPPSWESGHLGRLRAGRGDRPVAPTPGPLSQTGAVRGSGGPAESCHVHHT